MYLYWPLSFCTKKSLGLIQSYEDVPFLGPKWPFVMNKFFLQTIIITFIYLSALFIVQNSKKSLKRIQSYVDVPFWAQNGPLALIFFGKLLISLSSTHQPLSLYKIFKKFFQWIQSYEDVQVLGPKWPISPNDNFFQKTC